MKVDGLEFSCLFCNELIEEIYIQCEVCRHRAQEPSARSNICLECFSHGLETSEHKNDHAYRVVNLRAIETLNECDLFDDLVINSLASTHQLGFLNKLQSNSQIEAITSRLNAETCLQQLDSWFSLFGHSEHRKYRWRKPRLRSTMVLYKDPGVMSQPDSSMGNNLSSIRPGVHSKLYRAMSGYRASRGEFETESRESFEFKHIADMDYDQKNELEVPPDSPSSDTDLSDEQILSNLKLSVLSSYTDLIRNRYEKKKLVRQFGLISELAQNTLTGLRPGQAGRTSAGQYQAWLRPGERFSSSTDSVSHLQKFNTDSVHYWSLPAKLVRLFGDYESYAKTCELLNYFG